MCAQLSEEPPGLRETVERCCEYWRVTEWAIDPCRAGPSFVEIVEPGGFFLTVSPRAVELYHCMRFSTFSGYAEERRLLRRSCLVSLGASAVLNSSR